MTFEVDFNTIGVLAAVLVACGSWISSTKRQARADGRHVAEEQAMEKRVAALEGKVESLQDNISTLNSAIPEIKTNLEWIKNGMEEIKGSIAAIPRRKCDD